MDNEIKSYCKVFEQIKNSELEMEEFSKWMLEYYARAFDVGYRTGYNQCNKDNEELDRSN